MKNTIFGIALINGIKFSNYAITSTAKRKSDGQISIKIKKHSKFMKKFQPFLFFMVLLFSIFPDKSSTPKSIIYTMVIFALFIIILTFIPRLRIFNYHGAEHKVIIAYKNNLPLTMETVKPLSRVSNDCGTMLIAPIFIYVFCLSIILTISKNAFIHILFTAFFILSLFHYFFLRGKKISFVYLNKFLPFLKKEPYKLKTNILYKKFDKIGYFIQEHFTTKEPSDDELELALLCIKQLII